MGRSFKRIYGPALVATGPTTVVTVPALTQYVITGMTIMNQTGTAATITITIGADAAGTRFIATKSIPANDYIYIPGPLPVETAEIITLSTGTNNALNIVIGGYSVTI
jgi:hypothetical protein